MDFYDSRSVKSEVFIEGNIALYIAQAHTKPPFSQSKSGLEDNKVKSLLILSDNLHHFFVENGYLCDITLKNDDGERYQPHQGGSCREKRTNKWLAEQLGCAPTTVSKWCTNSSQPPMETYIKIAKLLNIAIEELINKDYINSVFPDLKEELVIYKDIH